jgi:hypothetical protein
MCNKRIQKVYRGVMSCPFCFFWIAKVLYVMLVGAYPFDGVREPMEKQIRHFGYVRSLQTLEKEGPHIYSGKK